MREATEAETGLLAPASHPSGWLCLHLGSSWSRPAPALPFKEEGCTAGGVAGLSGHGSRGPFQAIKFQIREQCPPPPGEFPTFLFASNTSLSLSLPVFFLLLFLCHLREVNPAHLNQTRCLGCLQIHSGGRSLDFPCQVGREWEEVGGRWGLGGRGCLVPEIDLWDKHFHFRPSQGINSKQ